MTLFRILGLILLWAGNKDCLAQTFHVWGDSSNRERALAACQLPDGDLIVFGDATNPANQTIDLCVQRISLSGNVLWRQYYGTAQEDFAGNSIHRMPNGQLVACGSAITNSNLHGDGLVLIIDDNGGLIDLSLHQAPGGHGHLDALSVAPDGTIYAVGAASDPFGTNDFWVLCLDSLGQFVYQQRLGRAGNQAAMSVNTHPQGGCVVAGDAMQSDTAIYQMRVYRLDATGLIVWQTNVENTNNGGNRSVLCDPAGDVYLSGEVSNEYSLFFDPYIARLDGNTGEVRWLRSPRFSDDATDPAMSIEWANPNIMAIVGYGLNPDNQSIDMYRMYMDSDGNYISHRFFAQDSAFDVCTDVLSLQSGGLAMIGRSTLPGSDTQFVVLLDDSDSPQLGIDDEPLSTAFISLSPNPLEAGATFSIKAGSENIFDNSPIQLYDSQGHLLYTWKFDSSQTYRIPPTLSAGVYVVRYGASSRRLIIR